MSGDSLISPNKQEADQAESQIRPAMLIDFIGQSAMKENLQIFIEAAKARKDTLDHVLLYGPPGLGKTTIAQIVAREMGVNFKATSGPILTKAGDLAAVLTNLSAGDVLFVDEIHRLHPTIEEVLYPAMEDFNLDLIIGEGPHARTIRIDLPHFTLVGATTRMGLITNPLRDRFGIPLRLEFYHYQELQMVIKRGAAILRIAISDEGAQEIAKRSRGTPRIALRLLKRVRDFALVKGDNIINQQIADQSLKQLGVDNLGLDSNDMRYLHYIAVNYDGGPVGVETIAAGLSEQRDTIEEMIEPFLLQQGFINRTPRGRMLTKKAFNHLGVKIPNGIMQLDLFADEE